MKLAWLVPTGSDLSISALTNAPTPETLLFTIGSPASEILDASNDRLDEYTFVNARGCSRAGVASL